MIYIYDDPGEGCVHCPFTDPKLGIFSTAYAEQDVVARCQRIVRSLRVALVELVLSSTQGRYLPYGQKVKPSYLVRIRCHDISQISTL